MMQTWLCSALFVLSALQRGQCYLQPAPVSVIQPNPTEYLDYLPKNIGKSNFEV